MWHFPLRKPCLTALFRRSNTDELGDLAKQLPWDHPIARTLDHEVHRRRIAGKSCRFFFHRPVWGPFLHSPFFQFVDVFPDLDFRRKSLGPPTFALALGDVD